MSKPTESRSESDLPDDLTEAMRGLSLAPLSAPNPTIVRKSRTAAAVEDISPLCSRPQKARAGRGGSRTSQAQSRVAASTATEAVQQPAKKNATAQAAPERAPPRVSPLGTAMVPLGQKGGGGPPSSSTTAQQPRVHSKKIEAVPRKERAVSEEERAAKDAEMALAAISARVPGLTVELRPFQRAGVHRLLHNETQGAGIGTLLADDMGMGKTVQTIALMLLRRIPRPSPKPWVENLVVVPASLRAQWRTEIRRLAPSLRVCVLLGDLPVSEAPSSMDVAIVSYEYVRRRSESLQIWHFGRVVLDEAHRIRSRNATTDRVLALQKSAGLCLTGTPVQNRQLDLEPLLEFLQHKHAHAVARTRAIVEMQTRLEGAMLRREKHSLFLGKPILELPPRTGVSLRVRPSDDERQAMRRLRQELTSAEASRTPGLSLSLLLRLRQACTHPALAEYGRKRSNSAEELIARVRGHPSAGPFIQQNSTQGCVSCGRTVANDSFCHLAPGKGFRRQSPAKGGLPSGCLALWCARCAPQWMQWIQSGEDMECPLCGESLRYESRAEEPAGLDEDDSLPADDEDDGGKALAEEEEKDPLSWKSLCSELLELMPSSKLDACVQRIRLEEGKAVVFSQWTSTLDLMEARLRQEGLACRLYDGRMGVVAREKVLAQFADETDAATFRILLVSTTCGGVGLNLTAANHVHMLDPLFNPSLEDQAVDRVYRLGQSRSVTVTRYFLQGSVEALFAERYHNAKRSDASRVFQGSATTALHWDSSSLLSQYSKHREETDESSTESVVEIPEGTEWNGR